MDVTWFRGRIDRPRYAWIAVAIQLLVAVAAIPVGIQMIADAEGAPLGLPQEWIDATPFGSYLIPGIALLLMNGVGQLVAAGSAIARHALAPWLTGALGLGLMIWIGVQVVSMPYHPLQPILFTAGIVEGLVALAWLHHESIVRSRSAEVASHV